MNFSLKALIFSIALSATVTQNLEAQQAKPVATERTWQQRLVKPAGKDDFYAAMKTCEEELQICRQGHVKSFDYFGRRKKRFHSKQR